MALASGPSTEFTSWGCAASAAGRVLEIPELFTQRSAGAVVREAIKTFSSDLSSGYSRPSYRGLVVMSAMLQTPLRRSFLSLSDPCSSGSILTGRAGGRILRGSAAKAVSTAEREYQGAA